MASAEPGVRTWQTWGTYVYLATEPASAIDSAAKQAVTILADIDQACSRFRADSELISLNARAGQPTEVGPLLSAALQIALEAATETDGLVDPTLGHSLVAVGYDRDFALLPAASSDPTALPRPVNPHSWRDIDIAIKEPNSPLSPAVVTLPPGCSVDLGATGKAWASDLLAHSIQEATGADVIISLGGDIRALGSTVWPITITETLDQTQPAVPTSLAEGGLATSTTMGRRWVRGGKERHHLLDPRTGEPTQGPWRTVSAFGPSAAAANTAATAAIVAGADALTWLTTREVPARLIAQDGSVAHTPNWPGA